MIIMNWNFDFTEKQIIISVFFCMAFTISNLITVKIIDLHFLGLEVPAGVLIYPLVYILTNVITDVYGEKAGSRTLLLGLGTDILFVFMTTSLLWFPSPAWYTGDSSLAFIFTVPLIDVVIMIITHWIIVLIWSAIAEPFTGKLVGWAKKGEPVKTS